MRYLGIFLLLFIQSADCQELRVTVERSEPKQFNIEIVKPQAGQDAISGTEARPADLSQYAVKLSVDRKILASGVNTSAGIVTCEHVVRGYSEFTAECDGETAKAVVRWWDAKNDVALLSVKWSKKHDVPSVKTSPLGEVLRLVGRGDNGLIQETSHKFLAVNHASEVTFSDPRNSGASGSGLFNESGELVAIFNGAIVDQEPYIGRAITIDKVPQLKGKAASASNQIQWRKYDAETLAMSKRDNKPMFAFFTADWCGPCHSMKNGALKETSVVDAIENGFIPVMLNAEQSAELFTSFGITTIPAIIVVKPDLTYSSKFTGMQNTAQILKILEANR